MLPGAVCRPWPEGGLRSCHQTEASDQRGCHDDNDDTGVLHQGYESRVGAQRVAHGEHPRGGARERSQGGRFPVEADQDREQQAHPEAKNQGTAYHEGHRQPVAGDQGHDRGPEGGGEHAAHHGERRYPSPARHRRVFLPEERHDERDEHGPDQPSRGQTGSLGKISRQSRPDAEG